MTTKLTLSGLQPVGAKEGGCFQEKYLQTILSLSGVEVAAPLSRPEGTS